MVLMVMFKFVMFFRWDAEKVRPLLYKGGGWSEIREQPQFPGGIWWRQYVLDSDSRRSKRMLNEWLDFVINPKYTWPIVRQLYFTGDEDFHELRTQPCAASQDPPGLVSKPWDETRQPLLTVPGICIGISRWLWVSLWLVLNVNSWFSHLILFQ